ncbi:(2Fe-2S) ferredoxin domain-containing protein [Rhodopseudomonas palustris]|uniref:(2Fe-2S) ferredoxin domain-containing protein n=1 Tax=Rhodopseudomonas palustris TaxID=1076 RepID=UPI000164AF24|nr:(2Fe-2S) ferredoxin domain-containing protein [Rhodopseudomonas palustris]
MPAPHPPDADRPYMTIMPAKSSPTIARPKRPPPVLICGKCLSKAGGGKKLKQALKAELKRAAAQGGKRPKLVTTGCLGICPKRAVVTASAATLGRGEYVLIEDRTEAAAAVKVLIEE